MSILILSGCQHPTFLDLQVCNNFFKIFLVSSLINAPHCSAIPDQYLSKRNQFNLSILSGANESVDVRVPDGNLTSLLVLKNLHFISSLLKEMEGKLKAKDQEKDNIIKDLNDMSTKYEKLRRRYIDEKTKSKMEMIKKRTEIIIINTKLQLEKEKTSLLPLGKFWQSIFHYIFQIIMKMLVLLLVLA